ncbi:MAG TPA: hypothetical protein VFM45_00880, partial [Anaeromyxobacteraceae bacterium]|nr:hypothetical protein [Anaeromyxobacteraceae bacterium]
DAGRYWACDQAVWYVAPTPKGPWTVSDQRPPDIDKVPPSAPVYNTKYVYVYQSTPQVVTVGYLPGYVGMYPYYGTVVYGTGFVYAPWVGPAVYYPRPVTYGFGVTYNPWVGFGFTYGWASPFVSVGVYYGGWGRPYYRPGWWGPPGYRPFPPPYPGGWYRPPPGYRPPPPRPGYGYRPPPPGGYRPPPPGGGGGGRPPAARPRGWSNNLYARPDNVARNVARPAPAAARPAPRPAGGPNNVYADRKGNVYRQNAGGSWDRNTPQGWKPQPATATSRPSTTTGSTRPAPSPGVGATTRPSTGGAPPSARPSPSTQVRPTPQTGGATRPAPTARPQTRPSYPSAPAGLGRDAAARQRTSPAAARPQGQPGGGHGGGHGGGRGR